MAWGIYEEDFADLTDWTDGDTGGAVSEISPAGQLHQVNTTSNVSARIYQTLGTGPGTGDYTFEVKFKFDTVPAAGGQPAHQIDIGGTTCCLRLQFYPASVKCYNNSAYVDIFEYTWVVDTWYVLRGIVHESQTDIDAYLDGVSKATDFGCGWVNSNDGFLDISANYNGAIAGCEWHVDYIYIGAGQQVPSTTSIKKVAGVEHASIKKIGGVAIGSVKKIAGVE